MATEMAIHLTIPPGTPPPPSDGGSGGGSPSTPTPGVPIPTPIPCPTPTLLNVEWLPSVFGNDGKWLITHYTIALESDPAYANPPLSDKFTVPGLDPNKTYRRGFIWGPRGTWFQGTGKSESGEYITIDYNETDIYNDNVIDFVFIYGKGGNSSIPIEAWQTAASRDPRLPNGTRFIVEAYPDKVFTKNDSGTDLADSSQVDLFVGEITLAEADYLNSNFSYSRVGILR